MGNQWTNGHDMVIISKADSLGPQLGFHPGDDLQTRLLWDMSFRQFKIAIEHGHRNSEFSHTKNKLKG